MKRLVKSAKQQFEERLKQLHVVRTWEKRSKEIYHHCIAADEEFVLLCEKDGKYSELLYGRTYKDVVSGERFLSMMTEYFAQTSTPVKSLFDWYASAGHDNEPFTLCDIYMSELGETLHPFEDLYEEVPDEPEILTAQEQWEKDSAGAEIVKTLADGSVYKVAVTDSSVTFFGKQRGGECFKEVYPPLDELRKDVNFVTSYLSHVHNTHGEDMEAALTWIQGGEYTMNKDSFLDIYEVQKGIERKCYQDKGESTEIIRQDFKEETEALRKKMAVHIGQLCEAGKNVDVTRLCLKRSLTWKDSCYVDCDELSDFWLEKDKNGEWIAVHCDWDGKKTSSLRVFSIDTLRDIIEAMQ